MARWLSLWLGVGLSACTVGDIDLSDRPCPCIDGYRCVGERCVPVGASDGGEADGGQSDGGPRDGGQRDGGLRDAFASDAFAPDARAPDAFAEDAGRLEGCEAAIGRRVLFCADFEQDLASAGWNVESNFGTVSRADVGASGLGARCETTASAGHAAIDHALPESRSGTLWARAWVRVPAPSFGSPVRERDAIAIGSGGERSVRVIAGDDGRLALEVDGAMDEAAAPEALEAGLCVRVQVSLATGTAGSAVLYVGAREVARIIDTPTLPAGGAIDRVWAGIVEVDGPIALEVDDVAIDGAELGCP